MAIHIVGYGTLLYTESVGNTIGTSASGKTYAPVIVSGFKRLFNLLPSHYKPSFKISDLPVEKAAANIIPVVTNHFNGLAFEVSESELEEIDKRERHYDRIEVEIYAFGSEKFKGNAFVYAAKKSQLALTNDATYLPDWIDIQWARTGAYRYGEAFGKMYDQTTYLADGKTLVMERYKKYLDQLIIKE